MHASFAPRVLLAVTLLIGPDASAQSPSAKYAKVEGEALQKIGAAWVETARKAAEGGHEILRMLALDQARSAGAEAPALAEIERKLMEPRRYVPFKDGPDAAAILAATRAEVAAAVAPVIAIEPSAAMPRFDEHLARALEGDAKNEKALALYQKRTAAALAAKDWAALRALVMRATDLDPEGYKKGKYKNAEQAVAANGGIVVRGRDHLMQAYVALPDGWSPKKTWPMFVGIVGGNCMYEREFKDMIQRGTRKPYILVVPMTIGNSNQLWSRIPYSRAVMDRYFPAGKEQLAPQAIEWDEQGLLCVLGEIRRRFSGDERFFLTGYSGGGHVMYWWLQHHSDQLVGACAASANYWPGTENGTVQPERGGCPVLIVTGSKDEAGPPRIFPQSDQGEKRLKDLGFTEVDRRHLEGRDHEPFYELGLGLLDKIIAGGKKK